MTTPTLPRNRNPRVLLGITGSVAAIKGPELSLRLLEHGFHVKVLLTVGGLNFWRKANDYDSKSWQLLQTKLDANEDSICIHSPDDEWHAWNRMGDPVLHIELRDWADVIVIAPLSAHTLAKTATGLCDDTLTSVLRAWDFGLVTSGTSSICRPPKPVVLAPAMNTAMWYHPLTQQQLQLIKSFSRSDTVTIVTPMVKTLACGEVGLGALAHLDDIVNAVLKAISCYEGYR